MYLERYEEDYLSSVYSIDLDGKNEKHIGTGRIEGIDEEKGILVCTLVDESNTYQLYQLDCASGKLSKYDLEIPCIEVVSIKDGVVYYLGFEFNGGVNMYLKASPHMTTLKPKVDYSFLKLEKDADYLTINDIEVCDGWVYYRLEANESNPEASIGWRDGYHRIKTTVVRQALKGQSAEALYEY